MSAKPLYGVVSIFAFVPNRCRVIMRTSDLETARKRAAKGYLGAACIVMEVARGQQWEWGYVVKNLSAGIARDDAYEVPTAAVELGTHGRVYAKKVG